MKCFPFEKHKKIKSMVLRGSSVSTAIKCLPFAIASGSRRLPINLGALDNPYMKPYQIKKSQPCTGDYKSIVNPPCLPQSCRPSTLKSLKTLPTLAVLLPSYQFSRGRNVAQSRPPPKEAIAECVYVLR